MISIPPLPEKMTAQRTAKAKNRRSRAASMGAGAERRTKGGGASLGPQGNGQEDAEGNKSAVVNENASDRGDVPYSAEEKVAIRYVLERLQRAAGKVGSQAGIAGRDRRQEEGVGQRRAHMDNSIGGRLLLRIRTICAVHGVRRDPERGPRNTIPEPHGQGGRFGRSLARSNASLSRSSLQLRSRTGLATFESGGASRSESSEPPGGDRFVFIHSPSSWPARLVFPTHAPR